MLTLHGKTDKPLLILHGGAGPQDPTKEWLKAATKELIGIAHRTARGLLTNTEPLDVIVDSLVGLEDCPTFNAGYGSALQSDGNARLTSSVMDGERQSFSGVISLSYVRNPSKLCKVLQTRSSRVLTSPGHELLARELGMPVANLVVPKRLATWLKIRETEGVGHSDTVGCVLKSEGNHLAAGSSTGGRGGEFPGRVSDSGTVAGNYASEVAAITCTGIGEDIVDDGVAVRLETRRRDGMSLKEASERTFAEALKRKRQYGWIGCDRDGHWVIAHTTPSMTYVLMTAKGRILASSLPA